MSFGLFSRNLQTCAGIPTTKFAAPTQSTGLCTTVSRYPGVHTDLSWPGQAVNSEDQSQTHEMIIIYKLPSRELTYPTLGSSENHLQNDIFGGYGFVPWRLSVLRIPNSKVAGTWNAFFKPCEVLCDGNTIFEAMATRKPGTLTVWGWNKFQVWNCNTGKIWKKINSWNYDVRSGESQQTKM